MGGMLRCAGRSSPPETERDKPGPYRALSMTLLLLKCKEINVSENKSYIHPSLPRRSSMLSGSSLISDLFEARIRAYGVTFPAPERPFYRHRRTTLGQCRTFLQDTGFHWPATVGAKFCGIRELKTTIQTIFVCEWATATRVKPLSSYRTIFFPRLPAEVVKFGLLYWKNSKAFFCWPTTVGAKFCGFKELKTTIQTII
jgi:hypothetical protein